MGEGATPLCGGNSICGGGRWLVRGGRRPARGEIAPCWGIPLWAGGKLAVRGEVDMGGTKTEDFPVVEGQRAAFARWRPASDYGWDGVTSR